MAGLIRKIVLVTKYFSKPKPLVGNKKLELDISNYATENRFN